jgi:hypothetical protein
MGRDVDSDKNESLCIYIDNITIGLSHDANHPNQDALSFNYHSRL